MTRRAARAIAALVLVLCAAPATALAQQPWATDPEAVAKDLFFRGVKLLEAGDNERALDAFLRSRAALPRKGNTTNAAIASERLNRFDEAMDLYEDVLRTFGAELSDVERRAVEAKLGVLRGNVGSVMVAANVEGASVQVDGRARGKLPLSQPLRLVRGPHVLRVVKNGFETRTEKIDVGAGQLSVDVELERVANAGEMRVESVDGRPADVFVDHAFVGATPWDGLLSPGPHTVWATRGDTGSAPASIIVIEGQTSLARLELVALGASVIIRAEPPSSLLAIDGVPVGGSAFAGRLPGGAHRASASEDGYFSRTISFDTTDASKPVDVVVRLPVDAAHPRWPKTEIGRFWLGAFAGYAGAPRLGGGAEAECSNRCPSDPPANGGFAIARLGYRFTPGVSLEIGGGYLGLQKQLFRYELDSFFAGGDDYEVRYDVRDDLLVRGPFVSFGISYAIALHARVALVPRISGGVFFGRATDVQLATARTSGPAREAIVYGPASDVTSIMPLVTPELGLEIAFGDAKLGAGLGVGFMPAIGPAFDGRSIGVAGSTDPDHPGDVGNAPLSDAIEHERSFGLVPIFMPQLSFRYEL